MSSRNDGESHDIIAVGARRRIRDLDIEPETLLIGFIGVLLFVVLAMGVWLFTRPSGACAGGICEGAEPVGIARTADGSAVAVHYVRCGNEAITRVAIESADTGQPLWELKGAYRGSRTAFVAGQATDELEETIEVGNLPADDLVAVIEGDSRHVAGFNRSELLSGFVLYQGFALTPDEFVQAARSNGECADWVPALGVGSARALQIGLLAAAAVVGIGLAVRYRPNKEDLLQ